MQRSTATAVVIFGTASRQLRRQSPSAQLLQSQPQHHHLLPAMTPHRLSATLDRWRRRSMHSAVEERRPLSTSSAAEYDQQPTSVSPVAARHNQHNHHNQHNEDNQHSHNNDHSDHNQHIHITEAVCNLQRLCDRLTHQNGQLDRHQYDTLLGEFVRSCSNAISMKLTRHALQSFETLTAASLKMHPDDRPVLRGTSEGNALIWSLCQARLVDQAFGAFNTMQQLWRWQPDGETFSTLIRAAMNNHRIGSAVSLWDKEAVAFGRSQQPFRPRDDLRPAFEALIRGLLLNQVYTEHALAIFDMMIYRAAVVNSIDSVIRHFPKDLRQSRDIAWVPAATVTTFQLAIRCLERLQWVRATKRYQHIMQVIYPGSEVAPQHTAGSAARTAKLTNYASTADLLMLFDVPDGDDAHPGTITNCIRTAISHGQSGLEPSLALHDRLIKSGCNVSVGTSTALVSAIVQHSNSLDLILARLNRLVCGAEVDSLSNSLSLADHERLSWLVSVAIKELINTKRQGRLAVALFQWASFVKHPPLILHGMAYRALFRMLRFPTAEHVSASCESSAKWQLLESIYAKMLDDAQQMYERTGSAAHVIDRNTLHILVTRLYASRRYEMAIQVAGDLSVFGIVAKNGTHASYCINDSKTILTSH